MVKIIKKKYRLPFIILQRSNLYLLFPVFSFQSHVNGDSVEARYKFLLHVPNTHVPTWLNLFLTAIMSYNYNCFHQPCLQLFSRFLFISSAPLFQFVTLVMVLLYILWFYVFVVGSLIKDVHFFCRDLILAAILQGKASNVSSFQIFFTTKGYR